MSSNAPHASRTLLRQAPVPHTPSTHRPAAPVQWVPWPHADTLYASPSEQHATTGRDQNEPSKGLTLALFFCFWLVISSFFLLLYAQRYLL
ncbi:MAG: hypothetical protein RhofKO_14100 [Rhodothermales bacterium]